ncbi:MAG: hypothetical protein WEA61_08185 [Anaerolineales bacterium]
MEKTPHSLFKHAGIALLVLSTSYVFFTLFPELFPHPSEFSSFAYAVAFTAMLEVWLLFVPGRRKWLYLPILIICLLALLDEIGYGSEVMDIRPFYSETLHTEIRDLHNAISVLITLGSDWLADLRWIGELSDFFLTLDAVLAAVCLALGWLLRRGLTGAREQAWQSRALSLTLSFTLFTSLAGATWLLVLPQDPKNAWLLGYSTVRLLSAAAILALSLAAGFLLWKQKTKSGEFTAGAKDFVQGRPGRLMMVGLGIAVLAGVAYQVYAPLVFLPDDRTRLERLTPLVIWLFAVALFWLMGALAWRGYFRRSATSVATGFIAFLKREPAFFYAGIALFLILIGQLNDKNILPLDDWIRTPNFRIRAWGLWTEEVFEMVAAFLLIVGTSFFSRGALKKKGTPK